MVTRKTTTSLTRAEMLMEIQQLRHEVDELKKIQSQKDERKNQDIRKRYISLFDNILDPVFIYDAATYRFIHCNRAAVNKYGFTYDEILTMTPFDLHRPEDFERVRNTIDKKSVDTTTTFILLTKDRRHCVVEIMTDEIYFESNPAWLRIVHDITDRIRMEEELERYKDRLLEMVDERSVELMLTNKKLEEEIQERKKVDMAIRASEKKFRDLIEQSLDGIMLVDEEGSIIEWNKGQEVIYGTARALVTGKKIWDVQFQFESEENKNGKTYQKLKKLWENFFHSGVNPFPADLQVVQIVRADGRTRDIQVSYFTIETGKGTMMACTSRDITDRLTMEKQLFQSQKMEALGTLAGGIAHDFNNVLGAIIGYVALAIRKCDPQSPISKYLNQVETASKRASDLVKQILTFSRRDNQVKEPLQLSVIVKEVAKLLRSSLPATVEIAVRIEAEKSYVLADPTQIHQVLMNLCTNAAHAMKEKGGTLEIRVAEEMVEPGIYKELKPGLHVRLSVSDTGHGIKPAMLDKIFEPFFTTKKPGEGTGMGLAVVHGIIKSHNGNISVYSKIGEGTTFSVLLPAVVDVIHKRREHSQSIPGGSEHLLLVEDDAALLDAEKDLLEELGYKVTALPGSPEALQLFEKVPNRFAIVVIDFIMPKMTGLQLAEKIRKIRADIPIIMCTGYSEVITRVEAKALGIGDIVMKPIDLATMAQSIRRLIEHPQTTSNGNDTGGTNEDVSPDQEEDSGELALDTGQ